MPETQPTMPEWLDAKRQLEQKLKDAGITEEHYIELFSLLDTVTGAEPEQIRNSQFREQAARQLCIEAKASPTEKNLYAVSKFLRQFAEHCAQHLFPDLEQEQLRQRVDTISDLEEEV